MNKTIFYIFALILIFLVLAYYKGFSTDTTSAGGVINNLVSTLQGRNSKTGALEAYPAG